MYLTDLADVLREAGLTVVEVSGWKTRGYRRLVGDTYRGDLLGVGSIIAHHTATKWSSAGDYPTLSTVQEGRVDLPGPLAQLGLGRSGTWYVIAAGYANHTGATFEVWQMNSYALGIEAEAAGTGDPRDWPEVQVHSYARGVKALADHYGVPYDRVLGHKEIAAPMGRKTDPSFDMEAFRARVRTTDITNPGGFLMGLTDDEQAILLKNSGETETLARQLVTKVDRLADDEAERRAADLAHQSASAARERLLLTAVETLSQNAGLDPAVVRAALDEALKGFSITLSNKEI
jgi:hypothetical protein